MHNEVVMLISGDREEPTAETPPRGIVFQPPRFHRNRLKHRLGQVGRIGVLKPSLPVEAVDDRRIQFHELMPCLGITCIADANQQAGSSDRCCGQGNLPPSTDDTARTRKPYTEFFPKSVQRWRAAMFLPAASRHSTRGRAPICRLAISFPRMHANGERDATEIHSKVSVPPHSEC